MVTTGHQKLPKMGQNSIISSIFCPKGKKRLGRSPPLELEVGSRCGLYLLVFVKAAFPIEIPIVTSKCYLHRAREKTKKVLESDNHGEQIGNMQNDQCWLWLKRETVKTVKRPSHWIHHQHFHQIPIKIPIKITI